MTALRNAAFSIVLGLWVGMAGAQESASGAQLYANHCAACHGEFAEGDGPVAAAMRVTMPNLRMLALRRDGTYPAEDIRAYIDGRSIPAAHGARYMPVWGDVFGWGSDDGDETEESETSDDRAANSIDVLVEYLRTLQYE